MRDDGEAPGRNGAADGEGELHGVLSFQPLEVDRLFPVLCNSINSTCSILTSGLRCISLITTAPESVLQYIIE